MPKPVYLLVALVFLSKAIYSQQSNRVITVSPAIMPSGTLAIQPGFQFRINEKYSLLSEVAIPVSSRAPEDIEKFTCFRVSTELKYYPKKAIKGRFIGMQLGLTYRKFSDLDSGRYFHVPYTKTATGYSSAKIYSPVIFFNLKLGREITHWGKFYLDYYLALGIRFIPTHFDTDGTYGIVYQEAQRRPCTVPNLDPAWENRRNSIRPGGGVGLRLGLKL